MVESYTASQSSLCDIADLGYEELIYLCRNSLSVVWQCLGLEKIRYNVSVSTRWVDVKLNVPPLVPIACLQICQWCASSIETVTKNEQEPTWGP